MREREFKEFPEPPGCRFNYGFCTDLEKGAIKYALDLVEDVSGLYMEVGVFEGRSAVFTANQIYPERLYCVDPWVPVPYAPASHKAYKEHSIEENFLHNVEVGTKGNIAIRKMKWQDLRDKTSKGAPIKYLYLDGPHGYEDVKEQLAYFVPQIAQGGVMIGDDYDDRRVRRAVNEHFGKKDMTHPESPRTWIWRNT